MHVYENVDVGTVEEADVSVKTKPRASELVDGSQGREGWRQ